MALRLVGMNRFPVKSCRAVPVRSSVVDVCGLAGDRRWMVVDDEGAQLTSREHHRMILTTVVERADGGLDLSHPDVAALSIPPTDPAQTAPVRVWRSDLHASLADETAHAWFSKLLGVPARLVHLDDVALRPPNPAFSLPGDSVSFADGYPILATNTASLDQLNDLIAVGDRADEGPLPMIRFRPNLVISGGEAWEEDGWRRVRIGDALFRSVKGCDRCVLTTVDPETATRGKEPIRTLARHRRWDGATWFGIQFIPDNPGATVRVGDEVEILEAVEAPDGPPRPEAA